MTPAAALRLGAAALMLALAGACGDETNDAQAPDATVLEPLTEALDESRAVEADVLRQAQELERRIEEAEGAAQR